MKNKQENEEDTEFTWKPLKRKNHGRGRNTQSTKSKLRDEYKFEIAPSNPQTKFKKVPNFLTQ
jgi:hypothetical protein